MNETRNLYESLKVVVASLPFPALPLSIFPLLFALLLLPFALLFAAPLLAIVASFPPLAPFPSLAPFLSLFVNAKYLKLSFALGICNASNVFVVS